METVLLNVMAPQYLPILFGFISCFVSGTLALGEGVIFMLLYEVSCSYGVFGVHSTRFQGVLFSLLISVFSQLPIIFAGRYEMSTVIGYGVCMALVSLCFITMGVSMLVSGHEDVLAYAAVGFMGFSFYQLLKASLEFGEQRCDQRSPTSPQCPQVLLDSTGTAVVSRQHGSAEFSHRQKHLISELVLGLRHKPSGLAALLDVSPLANVELCHRVIITIVFPDDDSPNTDQMLSKCIASMVHAEASSCTDMTTLLREDSLASKLLGAYCSRKSSQLCLSRILDHVFEAVANDVSASDTASPAQHLRELRSALNKIVPEVCSRMHLLPLGVQDSAAALVQALLARQHHQKQPLTVAAAVGSLVFLRCVVPHTVAYGARHAHLQKFFVDISSILQKISNGAEFQPCHRLVEMNAVISVLSPALHASFMSTFAAVTSRLAEVEAPPSCSSSSDAAFDLSDREDHARSKDDIRCFVHLLAASAAARATCCDAISAELSTSIMQLDHELWRTKQCDVEGDQQADVEAAYSSDVPHWQQISRFLKSNPRFAAAYEHFFPNISESGACVETTLVMLLIGKRNVCALTFAIVFQAA
jgi:hypothetical protein